jgi:hypothetical protein
MSEQFASQRIAIHASDARSALALERRLSHLEPTSVGRDDNWIVELDDDGDRLDEVLAAVRHWLREQGLECTAVDIDGVVHHIHVLTEVF